MKNKVLTFLTLFLLGGIYSFAVVPGKPPKKAPIDTNEIILIAVAVLLIVGAIAYRKLSIKKA